MSIVALAKLSQAQSQKVDPCGTDEYANEMRAKYPQIAEIEANFKNSWKQAIIQKYGPSAAKGTSSSPLYDQLTDSIYTAATKTKMVVPVVVHVIHDYGQQYVEDNDIYDMIKLMNDVYQAKNSDLSTVIPTFTSYIGNMNMEFRLAQKDPNGNPTIGITRRFSQLTHGGDDQAKFGQWDPSRYLNIWVEDRIGRGTTGGTILAYSTFPASAAQQPYTDGIIVGYQHLNNSGGLLYTMPHEAGHYFNLGHPWANNGKQAGEACGDDDVDDTPPTRGHFSTCPLADSVCASGYTKTYAYDSLGFPGSAVVDYPDTSNTQNIMDYSNCTVMFTKQQVLRMRSAMNNPVGNRNNLVTPLNLFTTGTDKVDLSGKFIRNDLKPVPDYSVESKSGNRTVYMCADGTTKFLFKNRSWRDTISTVAWEFQNGATPATSTDKTGTVQVAVTEPGWVTVKLTATGNNSGDSSVSTQRVYAADPNYKIDPMQGYFQEFNTTVNTDVDKWPIFNYYNNSNKWQINNNTGFYDKSCIVYTGYDVRSYPLSLVGTPSGDRDDFFTPAFNLNNMTSGECNLTFMYAGCYRTSNPKDMRDTLEIHYSTTCGDTWTKLVSYTKGELSTMGIYPLPYAPTWDGEWMQKSVSIPAAARSQDKIFFRFRYKPGVDNNQVGTGNNFYLDRINISPFPAGINTYLNDNKTVAIAPNPTNGSSYVIIKGTPNTPVQIQVTDVTGKIVYSVKQNLDNQVSRIEIPASAIAVKGMYMVHIVNNNQSHTEKLIAY